MGDSITLQRRGIKVDVHLSSFATFDLFEEHVQAKFELAAGFVIMDFDRESIIDEPNFVSMRAGDFWKRNPKVNRLFLVLDSISAPLEGDVELEVSYQPHYNTITKTGNANFSKVPHAVAELIDNSIQATTDNTGPRSIEVEVELGGRGGSFLIVRDNGKGMNASDLKDFATYFLTQENRGVHGPQGSSSPAFVEPNGARGGPAGGKAAAPRKVPTTFGKTKSSICSGFISKYGVGALQAGFYIGLCLTVITKTARLPDVCEFVMSETEFEKRAQTNAEMFRDKIKRRNPGKRAKKGPEAENSGPLAELLDRLRAEEVGKEHFTYIVLTLRDQHVEWFNHERGLLKRELASIYHYYLHPENCPDGILRDDNDLRSAEKAGTSEDEGHGGGENRCTQAAGLQALEITYTRRSGSRSDREAADVVRLGDVHDDLESRLNASRKDSFHFQMEVLHPNQNSRENGRRLPVTGMIHYYPYDGEKETRPAVKQDEDDDESVTVEAFWEGRLVPESHAAQLPFFPAHKLNKKEREALGSNWRRRIKGMLFFDWNFPISNNKLKLQFPEGDLNTALNTTYVLPKHPAVTYPGVRGRNIHKEFREWLIKCHETLDIEYRFKDKASVPPNSNFEKYLTMTFGKGGSTFTSTNRVKLPLTRPHVYGVIHFFRTEVDEDNEAAKVQPTFCLQRFPVEFFGADDRKMYPVTELDPKKSLQTDEEWTNAMMAFKKQLPERTVVMMTDTDRPLPKRLTIRTGKAESTRVSIQIFDGAKKPVVQIPHGKGLRVLSVLERAVEGGETKPVLKFIAKPFNQKQYDKMYFFEPMNIKEPGEYTWTVAVVKEGYKPSEDNNEPRLLAVVCHITVLPGNPIKAFLEEEDDWDSPIALGNLCWLPAFGVRLRDSSKCVCPMRSYKSVTVSCVEPDAFDIVHVTSGSATHEIAVGKSASAASGPLEYDHNSWKLIPKQTGLLSSVAYETRSIAFNVKVVAHMQKDRQQDSDEKIFTVPFRCNFQPGIPSELMLLSPAPDGLGGPALTADAGCGLPPFSLVALDACGNRTAPSPNDSWQVRLDITAASTDVPDDEAPEFAGPASEKVAGGAATFNDTVVKWAKALKAEGELVVVETTLLTGTTIGWGSGRDGKEVASTSFTVRVMPSKVPFRAVVCLGGTAWPTPEEVERVPVAGTAAARASDSSPVRRSYTAGSVISSLHLRLYDQGGSEVVVDKDTFDASNKEAVTCSWETTWRWPGDGVNRGLGYDLLPDLKVPTQLSKLDNGIHNAKVVVTPKAPGGWPPMPLTASFAFAVHAGPVARWMAVRASADGKFTDHVRPLEVTAGGDAKACYESFKTVVKGFVPVDDFGNFVKDVPRAPEITLEGMPLTNLLPENPCELMKPSKPNGFYQFPRSLNLEGPPGQKGHLAIMCDSSSSKTMNEGGGAAGGADQPGGRSGDVGCVGSSSGNVENDLRMLRLAVSIKAGDPVKLQIRSLKLGVEVFTSCIRTTQLAGVLVDDLEFRLVDKSGFPAHIGRKGVRLMVTPRESLAVAGAKGAGTSRGGGGGGEGKNAAAVKRDLCKRATDKPESTMPKFSLDPGRIQAAVAAAGRSTALVETAEEMADRTAREGVVLVVRAEASDHEISAATIFWTRQRTCAVTKVNVAVLAPPPASSPTSSSTQPSSALQEPTMLPSAIGQRARKTGFIRPVDGPLPSLVVWLDTDNGSPCTPPHECIALAITSVSEFDTGSTRTQANLYAPPVAAPAEFDKHGALVFHPKREAAMEQNVGEHKIVCTYVERRALAAQGLATQGSQGSQGQEDERVVELVLRVVPGAPYKLEPLSEDANLFHSLSASNQEPINPRDKAAADARQLVERTFRFTANDIRGNHAGQIKGPVRMRIENMEGEHVPVSEMPRLEEADNNGYVFADPTATGVFLFEENWLKAGVGSKEGIYKLVVDSGGDPDLKPWSSTFQFETDEKRLNSIREVKARLKPLEEKLDRFESAQHVARKREESALAQAHEAFGRLPANLRRDIDFTSQDYAACVEQSQRLLAKFEQELHNIRSIKVRPAKFEYGRMRQEKEAAIQPQGYVVELGYVDDEYRAKLISHKGGSKMRAVYVDTKKQLDMVRKTNTGCFCTETVATYNVPGENRGRNAEEIASGQLPVRHIRDKGYLGYLVNMIQLPEEREHMRDTIFSAIFGSTVMFDTHDNAHAYQARCKRERNRPLPIIIEEDGSLLEQNGYMPPVRNPDFLNKLGHVFGSMPPHLTSAFKDRDRYIKKLKNLVPALQEVLDAEAEVATVEASHDANGWREEIDKLTNELSDLMSRAKPTKLIGGRSGAKGVGSSSKANWGGSGGGGGNNNGKRRSSGGGGKAFKQKASESSVTASAARGRQAKRPRYEG